MPTTTASLWIELIAFIAVLTAVVALLLYFRSQKRVRMLKALLQSFDKPILFYDESGRLAFHSAGLVLFDRASLSGIGKPPATPTKTQTAIGEIIIDFNRYRYTAKLLEYIPGTYGTLVMLEYQGSISANKTE